MNDPITREEYQLNNNIIMKEIKDLRKDVGDIKIEIAGLPEKIRKIMSDNYVSKDSFEPVRKITYGLVGAVLLGVVGAVLALIFR